MTSHDINNRSIYAKRFEEICDLFDLVQVLTLSDDHKRELIQVLAHRAFMLASIQCDDWSIIDQLFRFHRQVGFTRIDARIAAEVVRAECAFELADDATLHTAIDELEQTLTESGDLNDGESKLSSRIRMWRERTKNEISGDDMESG